ncbi:MAG: FkbM family methyltransferase [Cyclobacteriaceae bacterium]
MMKKLFISLLSRFRSLRYFNLVATYARNGSKVRIPVIKSLGSGNLWLSELWMCEVLEILLPLKKGCFIDIGVNVGQSLIKLKLVDGTVPYLGFDPNPVCIYYTGELIRENKYENAVLVPVGLSSRNEMVTLNLYSDGASDSAASMVKDFRPHDRIFAKKFVASFEYEKIKECLPQGDVCVVKIDVEGAEVEVFTGIRKLLLEKRPFVLIEVLPVYSEKNLVRWERQRQLEQLIRDSNYKLFMISASKTKFNSFKPLETIGVNTKIENSDYFLCPAESVSQLTRHFQ